MSEKSSYGFAKTATIITFITLVSKAFGFLREVLIAYYFGTSTEVDMYLMAVNIPAIVLGFITCVGTAYVPVYSELFIKEGKKKSLGFTTQLILVMSVICGTIILVCSLNAEFVTRLVAPGFSQDMTARTAEYLRISMWNLLITTLINIFICYLNSNNKFNQASFCMLFHSSVQIIFTVLAHYIGPVFLTIGYVVANLFYLVALIVVSSRNDYKFDTIYYDRKYSNMLLKLLIPIAISSLVTQINGYVDKYFASGLTEGSISALHYSNTIRTFVIMMLNTGLTTVFFPAVSRMVAEGSMDKARRTLISAIRYVIAVFIPITVLLIAFSRPITKLLFERGQFNTTSFELTSIAVQMYAIGIAAVALRDIFFNFYYSVKDTTFTLVVSIIGITVNVGLNAVLVNIIGVGGLALATSASAVASIPIFALRMKKHYGTNNNGNGIIKYVFTCIAANIVPLIIVVANSLIGYKDNIIISIAEGVSYLIVYYLMLKVFRVEEADLLKDFALKMARRIKRN